MPDPPDADDLTSGDSPGDAANKLTPGKYLLLSVPDFAVDPLDGATSMTSYLRLGVSSASGKEATHDKALFDKIPASNPPGGHLTPTGTPINGAAEDPKGTFVDDQRVRGAAPGHGLSVADRQTYSQWLHGRGGWRDHSDGNRITTTYGDKVEVVRGNYRMLVLGRQDDASLASGWDASGNHVQDFAPGTMPGASVRVEYEQTYGGAWHLQNTTEGVVQSSNFAGDFYEYHWGDHQESTTGSEDPAHLRNVGGVNLPRGNPAIIEKTWASSIYGQTGSAALPVPVVTEKSWVAEGVSHAGSEDKPNLSMVERTFCNTIASYTGSATKRALSIHEETWAVKTETHTHVGAADEHTTCEGTLFSKTESATINEITMAGAIASTTLAGASADTSLVGAKLDTSIGAVAVDTTIAAFILELFLGIKVSIDLSATLEVKLSPHTQVSIPDDLEIGLRKLRVRLQNQIAALEDKTVALESSVTALHVALGVG